MINNSSKSTRESNDHGQKHTQKRTTTMIRMEKTMIMINITKEGDTRFSPNHSFLCVIMDVPRSEAQILFTHHAPKKPFIVHEFF
jgi:hypothetical protein